MEQGNFRPSSRGLDAREYFAEYSAWRSKALGDLEEEEVVAPIEILETGAVDPETVTSASPKKYIALALNGGLTVKCHKSVTLKLGTVFKSGDRQGERRPDKTTTHLWTTAFIRGGMAFQTYHVDNRFTDALVWDAAGWPTILQADYSYDKNEQKSRQLTEKRAAEIELRMVNDYNDDTLWTNRAPRVVTSVAAFEEWLADLFPAFQAKTPAIKKPKETKEETLTKAMLAGTEWSTE